MKINVIDLFAGCGGLSLGLEQAGFYPVYVNELNTDALEYTFTHNLSFKYVLVQAYDTADEMIVPATVRLVDANNVFVRFSNPQNGTIVIQK